MTVFFKISSELSRLAVGEPDNNVMGNLSTTGAPLNPATAVLGNPQTMVGSTLAEGTFGTPAQRALPVKYSKVFAYDALYDEDDEKERELLCVSLDEFAFIFAFHGC